MSKFEIKKSDLKGEIFVPPSKSHTLRAILFAMMGKGKSFIHNYLSSPDTVSMIEAARTFQTKVSIQPKSLEITGLNGMLPKAEDVIDSGNSGQVLRFIGALAALSDGYTIITGDHSIRHNRPVKPLLDALKQLNVFAESSRLDYYAPIIIKGPLHPGKATLDGEDSQPISGLLIASAFANGLTSLFVNNPGEKPWIDLTLHWFDRLGITYTNHHYNHYQMKGNQSYQGFEINIPGDFSSAAYPLAAALITNSELRIKNIDMSDIQGDKKLIDVLQEMGANIQFEQNAILVKKGSYLQGKQIVINDFIDAITILAVIGCFAEGETKIIGAGIARKKECDRIHAICTELKKMGADIEELEDGLIVRQSKLKGTGDLQTYKDHRMVLSLAVAAMGADGISHIHEIESAAKTYSTFYKDFKQLGANIEVTK